MRTGRAILYVLSVASMVLTVIAGAFAQGQARLDGRWTTIVTAQEIKTGIVPPGGHNYFGVFLLCQGRTIFGAFNLMRYDRVRSITFASKSMSLTLQGGRHVDEGLGEEYFRVQRVPSKLLDVLASGPVAVRSVHGVLHLPNDNATQAVLEFRRHCRAL